jgi:hypothetical protein
VRALLLVLLLAGCAVDEACAPVCPSMGGWYEVCLDRWGLDWGPSVGYEDRADWDTWCATILDEDRLLAATSTDPDAEARRIEGCASKLAAVEADDCGAYAGLWEGP